MDDCVNVEKKKQRITREKETKKRRDEKKEDMNKEELKTNCSKRIKIVLKKGDTRFLKVDLMKQLKL